MKKNGKIPEKLKVQWSDDKKRIDRLLNRQKLLYYILLITVLLCLIYGFYKLLSLSLCLKKLFSSLSCFMV